MRIILIIFLAFSILNFNPNAGFFKQKSFGSEERVDRKLLQNRNKEIKNYINRLNNLSQNFLKIDQNEISLEIDNNTKIDFIFIPGTTSEEWKRISKGRDYFLKGNNEFEYNPVSFIKIDYGFYISKTEITQEQWQKVMGYNPSQNKNKHKNKIKNLPVESISWAESYDFIDKLASRKSTKYIVFDDYQLRLPTEAEWEYAARAGMWDLNQNYLESISWYGVSKRGIMPVGLKKPNPWGIYDIIGNVFELTHDCKPDESEIKFGNFNEIKINPVGKDSDVNFRGGAYHSSANYSSFASRSSCRTKTYSRDDIGLRLAIGPKISLLNRDYSYYPKSESKLINFKPKSLLKLSENDCNEGIRVKNAYITEEYNDSIVLKICYENIRDNEARFSVRVTDSKTKNVPRTGYTPNRVLQGEGCVKSKITSSNLNDFKTDTISIYPYDESGKKFGCKTEFFFKKGWTKYPNLQ